MGGSLGLEAIAKITPAANKETKKKKKDKEKKEKPGKPKLTGLAYYWNKMDNMFERVMQIK